MKKVIAMVVLALAMSAPSQAKAYDKACYAYLCVMVSFAHPACDVVRVAMYKRIFKLKPPVPSFDSCLRGGELPDLDLPDDFQIFTTSGEQEDWRFRERRASLIYPKTQNLKGEWVNVPDRTIPPRIIEGAYCEDLTKEDLAPDIEGGTPWMCVSKMKAMWMDLNGEQYSDTYYMNNGYNNPYRYDIRDFTFVRETDTLKPLLNRYLSQEEIDAITEEELAE